jgi:acyl carrier protein
MNTGTTLLESNISAVNRIVATHLEIKIEEVTPEADISGDLGADSLDVVHICMELEERFELSIPQEWMEKVHTMADLYEVMAECLGAKQVKG